MKRLLLSLLTFTTVAFAAEIDSSEGGVEILREKFTHADHTGYRYWARNNNAYAVAVTIKINDDSNVVDGLIKDKQTVYPKQQVYLGVVTQASPSKSYSWHYKWTAVPIKSAQGTGRGH